MVCWPSIESKGSLDGHVGLVRALKPRNLLAWTYSEKVMHACLQMHVGWFGYQFRAKITVICSQRGIQKIVHFQTY